MTSEEILHHYNRMVEIFGELPDPEHEPIRFKYCVKLYRYYYEQPRHADSPAPGTNP